MKLVISVLITIFWSCPIILAQESMDAFGHKIVYSKPETSIWHMIQNSEPSTGNKGVLMFKREPILDSKKRPIEPIMAIIYERVPASIDVIEYSVSMLLTKPYQINRELLGGYPDHSSDMHAVVFKGEYVRDSVKHTVFLGYIVYEQIGIEIIADATEEVFGKTKSDMAAFLKSVNIKK